MLRPRLERGARPGAARRATVQNNLGTVLLRLGKRKGDSVLGCRALAAHALAWIQYDEAKASFWTSHALKGARADLALLREKFPQAADDCIRSHEAALRRMGLLP